MAIDDAIEPSTGVIRAHHDEQRIGMRSVQPSHATDDCIGLLRTGHETEVANDERFLWKPQTAASLVPTHSEHLSRRGARVVGDHLDRSSRCLPADLVSGPGGVDHDAPCAASHVRGEGKEEFLKVAGDAMDLQGGYPSTELGPVLLGEDLLVPVPVPGPEPPLYHEVGDEVVKRQIVEYENSRPCKRRFVHELVPRIVSEMVVHGVVPIC
jgi:hypothetical protein